MRKLTWAMGFLLVLTVSRAGAVSPDESYKAGLASYGNGEYDKAIQYFQSAIEQNPNYWQAFQTMGNCYYRQKQTEKAIEAFQQSLKIHPDNAALDKFVKTLRPVSDPAPVLAASSSVPALTVAPVVNPGSKSGHVFWKLYMGLGYAMLEDFGKQADFWKNQGATLRSASGLSTYYAGTEVGYCLDDQNGIGVSADSVLYRTSTIDYVDSAPTTFYQYFESSGATLGANYYRFLSDHDGRWIGMVGINYCAQNIDYHERFSNPGGDVSFYSGEDPASSDYFHNGALGGALGVGRLFDLGGINFELFAKFKYAKIEKIGGAYTGRVSGSNVSGNGHLVVLTNGDIALIDDDLYVPAMGKYANMDLSGVEIRGAFDIWF